DADDERIAGVITERLLRPNNDPDEVAHLGDDAQLLAGATLALLEKPDRYQDLTAILQIALGESFRNDPVIGFASAHPMLELRPPPKGVLAGPDAPAEGDPRSGPQGPGVGGPPEATPQHPQPPDDPDTSPSG